MPVNYTNGQCAAIKRNNQQCLNNSQVDSIFCGSHQNWQGKVFTPANTEVISNQARSFAQQSEETKEVVREAVRKITNNEEPMTRIEMNQQFMDEKKEDYEFIAGGTGSRSLKNASTNTKAWVAHYMRYVLKQLKEKYGDKLAVLSGMAEGFDELIARIAMELKIDLIAAIPSPDYGNYYWGKNSVTGTNRIEEFNIIMEYAKNTGNVIFVCDDYRGYAPQRPGKANFDRNDFMVGLASGFYVWNPIPTSFGTRDCVARIEKAGKRFVNIEERLPEYIEKVTAKQ